MAFFVIPKFNKIGKIHDKGEVKNDPQHTELKKLLYDKLMLLLPS